MKQVVEPNKCHGNFGTEYFLKNYSGKLTFMKQYSIKLFYIVGQIVYV